MSVRHDFRLILVLFLLGFMGIISTLPMIPKMIALQSEKPPLSIEIIQVISVIQSSVLLLIAIFVGNYFSKKVSLTSPLLEAIADSKSMIAKIIPQLAPAVIGGLVGGVLILLFSAAYLPYLPIDFIKSTESLNPPWYTKVLYGGITEEILVRWGLMSFLVWIFYRLTQQNKSPIKSYNYILAIFLSALIFGAGHLPIALSISSIIDAHLIIYIVLSNAIFGFIAGGLYWKYGLECSMFAHIIAHIVIIIGQFLLK